GENHLRNRHSAAGSVDATGQNPRNPADARGPRPDSRRQYSAPDRPPMIIDVHAYIGRWPYWPVPVSTPPEVLDAMDAAGIDCAVISSTRALFTSWTDGNAEARTAAAQYAGRFVAFDTAGPPEFSHTLQGPILRIDGEVKGLRIFPQYHTYHLLYEPFIDSL